MELVHTLLFLLRENRLREDLEKAEKCLNSLEKSGYKTVVIYNQGFWDNETLAEYLNAFQLEHLIIGNGKNVGIVAGRQYCFSYIWENFPAIDFISELHLDMIFTFNWEKPLVEYLKANDEPVISCGIIAKDGTLYFLNEAMAITPENAENDMDNYLLKLRRDLVVNGFTHPCIHKAEVLKSIGGYDTYFLTGTQAFEDDSLLLGYHYYYGIRHNWRPKVNYNSVVYHEVAGQRLGIYGNEMINFIGLVRQYGAMGLKHLSELHQSQWHRNYFASQYKTLRDVSKQSSKTKSAVNKNN